MAMKVVSKGAIHVEIKKKGGGGGVAKTKITGLSPPLNFIQPLEGSYGSSLSRLCSMA